MTDLRKISTLAEQLVTLDNRIAKGEQLLKELNEQRRIIAEEFIPQAMDEAGLEEFRLKDGSSITVENVVTAGISEANAIPAFDWLRRNGHGGIIKREIKLNFGKGEDKKAAKLLGILAKNSLEPSSNKETVHWQTLRAFVKEQLAEGADLPLELLGVHEVRRAKVAQAS